jgi:transposase
MHIERVPNRNSPPAVLLRQSYREGGKVRKRTLANLSKLPDDAIEGLRILLKGLDWITALRAPQIRDLVEQIEAEANLDGMYVIRTSVSQSMLDDPSTVKAYKGLSVVEQAFRCYKTIDLKVRPIYHRASSSGASARVFMFVGLLCGMAHA